MKFYQGEKKEEF